jgi:uncharacterized protein (TIRG00374 family)
MKKYLKILKILISVGILTFLFYRIDIGVLAEQFFKIRFVIFAFAFTILFIQCALSSVKWKVILSADEKPVPYLFLLKSYLIGNFISLFLPTSFGGDLYRIYALKEYNKDYLQNTSSVLFDRITGLFALLSISILSFALFFGSMIDVAILALYAAAILVFWIMTTRWFLKFFEKFKSKLVQFPRRILISFSQYRSNIPVLLASLCISFFFQSNIVFLNKIYSVALNIDISTAYLFMAIPLVYLTEALPISINGLGIREGAFVFFLNQAGFTSEQGLALGLLVISMRYLFAVSLGGSLFFVEMIKLKTGGKPREVIT